MFWNKRKYNFSHIRKIEGQYYIVQPFVFSNKVMQSCFAGVDFIGVDTKNYCDVVQRVQEAGVDGFMPSLVKEIEEILGDGNYIYNGYSLGVDQFNFIFFIKIDKYVSKMKVLKDWLVYKEWNSLSNIPILQLS
jgi:hypothetical protein